MEGFTIGKDNFHVRNLYFFISCLINIKAKNEAKGFYFTALIELLKSNPYH